jgi:hypothetical protein
MDINYAAIINNIVVITVTVGLVLAVYALKTLKTSVATSTWLMTNWLRFAVGLVVIAAISALIVVSPNASALFGALGFNADQSPIALGLSVAGLLIGSTSAPAEGGA